MYLLDLVMIELNKIKLLAQGGQAEIYELDNDKVIRVLRNVEEEEYLKAEMATMQALKKKNKAVPTVYEYTKINGRPSIIMERLKGDTMLDHIKKNPLQLFKYAEKLASLHVDTTSSVEGLVLILINDRAAHLIQKAEMLDDDVKKFVLDILKELPKGMDVCHGDFHPGNIMIVDNKYYVIDWFGATYGRKLSDIAHTYLILRNTPKIPGISKFQNYLIGISGSIISGKYLSALEKIQSIDYSEFSRWMVIRAAERVYYGMPFEKEALVNFLKRCMRAQSGGVNPDGWWKLI
ncbi:aminoglycoside phosphotransferase [Clostridium folliculivorans]|uniref:Aminoglycoside phosphotransferase n=2 Tax=Clostridium folliculivorans TaxID=2886038 RepID=A0A9W6DAN1_9CLOT|nr:phosphotransferase [Clostridium folliculivorans]GKU24992.1 aminoglycoside phosphotransferase [Clostridium folliculivorans]GKU31090.1 aminoglycoside phosphotransferase [Clostridium folliculivorans]